MTATQEVREEVERALSGTSLPSQTRQEVVTRASAVVEKYASAYPHPEILKQIEALAPGSTALIVETAAETIRHNNQIEKDELALRGRELDLIDSLASRDFSSVSQGRRYGLIGFILILIFSGVMYYLGAEKLSYVAFGVGSLGIISQLITGGRKLAISATSRSANSGQGQKAKANHATAVVPAGKTK